MTKNLTIAKLAHGTLFLFLFFAFLIFARQFLIPFLFSAILALLLLPVVTYLQRKGVNKVIAIAVALLIIFIVLSGIVMLFMNQVTNLAEDLPMIKEKLSGKLTLLQSRIEDFTNITAQEQISYLRERYESMLSNSTGMIRDVIFGFTGFLAVFGIVMVYIFFFLLYRHRIKNFVLMLFPKDEHSKIITIITRIKLLIQHYLIGIIIELSILGLLNSIGLLILGIKQPFFFGYLAAVLNIIPYVGVLIGSLFPIAMALIFKDSIWSAIAVAGVMTFNQFIDNNFLTPKIVGSHVRINPLVAIMAIFAGGLMWGVAGMILFIPLLGMFKTVCDNVDVLNPIGYFLGDDDEKGAKT